MLFEWDEEKDRVNVRKHDVSFATATLVFEDPYSLTQRDPTSEDEVRFITIGAIGPGAVLFVVHVSYENADHQEVVRIISARAATSRERRSYEEAYKAAATRNRGHRYETRRGNRSF